MPPVYATEPLPVQVDSFASVSAATPFPTIARPLPPEALGHYRTSHRCALVATQAAASRLFGFRNGGTNILIPTSIRLRWLQTAAHTAAIEDSLDLYRATAYTAADSVNIVTPGAFRLRTTFAAAPGGAVITGATVAGAAAGMTGGTLTKDSAPYASLPQWLLLAQPTASVVVPASAELLGVSDKEHPMALAANEGFVIENRVLLGAAAGSMVYVDVAYAEVTTY